MTMESASDSGVQGTASSSSGSPAGDNVTMMQAVQSPAGHMDTQVTAATQLAGVSMPQGFVMAPPATTGAQNPQLMMQPPVSVPLLQPYQMILPSGGVVDSQGQLVATQGGDGSREQTPGSPAVVDGRGSRSATPQQVLYQSQPLGQLVKAEGSEAVASPARQGSVGSGGSPAPPTPGSMGSPLPQMLPDGTMHPPHGIQFPVQSAYPAGLNLTQDAAAPSPDHSKEEKIDISKLKPPKKPLTPYMRFSKAIWQQVKAANPSMSVCEIGATIGRMWRELADTEKQKYNEEFANDKISYDQELQRYLKLTGLQASDLVKPRPKKKGSAAKLEEAKSKKAAAAAAAAAAAQAAASPQTPADSGVVQQVGGQQLVPLNGPMPVSMNSSMPQQVLSGALSGLPHFSQVWTGQQGATMLSQGMQGGGQEQVIVQQGGPGQQVLINTLGLPPGTVVNGTTGQHGGDNVISHPILIQPSGEQATQLFSAESAEGQKGEGEAATSQAPTQLLSLHQVGDLQQQQNVLSLLNMAAAQSGVQPDQLSQAAQIAGLQPPTLSLQQVVPSASDSSQSPATSHAAEAMQTSSTQQPSAVLVDQNGTPVNSVSNGPQTSSQAVVTVPTAHNLYNSYGFNPWSAFPQQLVQASAGGEGQEALGEGATLAAPGGIQVVYNRESILETELQHLRNALSEKTKEVQRLSQDLEKAYNIIEQLKQQNPTAVIHLPAPTEPDPGTPQPPSTT